MGDSPRHSLPWKCGGPVAPLKLGQRLWPRPYRAPQPRLLPEGTASSARERKGGGLPAALTDLSATPSVLGAAVQDIREQLRVEAGAGPLFLQVLIHGDGRLRQRGAEAAAETASVAAATAGVRSSGAGPALRAAPVQGESPPPAAPARPGPPLLLHRGPKARDRQRAGREAVAVTLWAPPGRASPLFSASGASDQPSDKWTPEEGTIMLPKPGIYFFPWEVSAGQVPDGNTLRTFGRLCSYDMTQSQVTLMAQLRSDQYPILVCTKLVEPFQAQLGSLYTVLGELEHQKDGSCVVKARVLTCVEGMNLPLLEQAVREQRLYQQERDSGQ